MEDYYSVLSRYPPPAVGFKLIPQENKNLRFFSQFSGSAFLTELSSSVLFVIYSSKSEILSS
jgi:hypothetical protein